MVFQCKYHQLCVTCHHQREGLDNQHLQYLHEDDGMEVEARERFRQCPLWTDLRGLTDAVSRMGSDDGGWGTGGGIGLRAREGASR